MMKSKKNQQPFLLLFECEHSFFSPETPFHRFRIFCPPLRSLLLSSLWGLE